MFPEQLKKILNLIKRNRERVILFDSQNPDDSYVLMDLDAYSQMSQSEKNVPVEEKIDLEDEEKKPVNKALKEEKENLTEEDLTDKINREISAWKNNQDADSSIVDDRPKKAWSIPSQVKNKAQEVE